MTHDMLSARQRSEAALASLHSLMPRDPIGTICLSLDAVFGERAKEVAVRQIGASTGQARSVWEMVLVRLQAANQP